MRSIKNRIGFTLLELVIVVLIIGIIAAIAVPKVIEFSQDAIAAAELQNSRMFIEAVQRYESANGKLPDDAGPGGFPSDLDGYLSQHFFSSGSPAGGQYDWDGPPPHAVPRLKVRLPVGTNAATQSFYLQLETLADDGSPTTGWITASGRIVSFWY